MAASRTLQVIITGDAAGARRAFDDVQNATTSLSTKLQDVGKSMMRTGAIMTATITAPLVLLGKTAFDASSSLTESLNKVDVVFAENGKIIRKWSQNAATDLLMSRQAALEAAGTFGNLFRALGVGLKPATDMSKSLVQLAADLASFNDSNPEDVLLALRSGLVGEAEPLRKFGVQLSEARVQSKVLELGLQDLDGSVSDSAKTMARYAIIMEDTVLAQGDAARTAGGAANQQRKLQARFQDTAAQLGKTLIPIFLQVAEIAEKVFSAFSNLSPEVQQFGVYIAIAAAVMGPLVTTIGAFATAIGFIISPVGLIVVSIGLLVAATVALYLKWDQVWTWMKEHPAITAIIAMLTGPITIPIFALVAVIKFLQANWDTIWPAIQGTLQTVWNIIRPILAFMDAAIRTIIDVITFLGGVAGGLFGAVASAVQFMWGVVSGPLNTLIAVVRTIIDVVGWLGGMAGSAFGAFASAVQTMWNTVSGPLGWLYNRIQDVIGAARTLKNALGAISGAVGGAIGAVGDVLGLAEGGPVKAGTPYIVGEQGPELFVPNASGTIIPNGTSTGSLATGDTTIVVQLDSGVLLRALVPKVNQQAQAGPVFVKAAIAS